MDENGEAYAGDQGELADRFGLIRFRDESQKEISLGQFVFDSSYIKYVLDARRKITELAGIEVENELWTPAIISDDVRLRTSEGWAIYLNEKTDLGQEVEILKIVLEKEISQIQRQDLEYIDLRINNKVYYKFREGTSSEDARVAQMEAEHLVPTDQATTTDAANSTSSEKKKKR